MAGGGTEGGGRRAGGGREAARSRFLGRPHATPRVRGLVTFQCGTEMATDCCGMTKMVIEPDLMACSETTATTTATTTMIKRRAATARPHKLAAERDADSTSGVDCRVCRVPLSAFRTACRPHWRLEMEGCRVENKGEEKQKIAAAPTCRPRQPSMGLPKRVERLICKRGHSSTALIDSPGRGHLT